MSQSTVNVESSILKRRMVLYTVVCTSIATVATSVAIFSPKVQLGFFGYIALFVSGSIFTTIGALAGDTLRRLAMPDLYFTRGFADSIKKRIFWAIGPQAIGWFLGTIATTGFMQNYLGYDMRAGQGRAVSVSTTERAAPEGVGTSIDIDALQKPPAERPAKSNNEQPASKGQGFQVIEVGACVMGQTRPTTTGLEFVRPIPVYSQGGSVEPVGTMQTFSAFYAEEQHSATGRVRLMYAPGTFDDEPKSGEVLGWVDAADLQVYDQHNCQ